MVLPHFLSPVAEEGLVRYSISLPRDGGVFNSGKILKHFNGNSFLEGVVDIVVPGCGTAAVEGHVAVTEINILDSG